MEYGKILLDFILEKIGYPVHYEVFMTKTSTTIRVFSERLNQDMVEVFQGSVEVQKPLYNLKVCQINFWDNNTLLIHLEI